MRVGAKPRLGIQGAMSSDLVIDELDLLGIGTPAPVPFAVAYARDLTPDDLVILDTVPAGETVTPVKRLRFAHHTLARLLAGGKAPAEAAAITGHAVQRVRDLQSGDPAFRELIAHYKSVIDQQYMDAAARLAMLGMTATEELQERIEESPGKFTNRELKEVIEMAFDRSAAPKKATSGPSASNGAGVNINVSFVPAQSTQEPPVIEVSATKQIEEQKK